MLEIQDHGAVREIRLDGRPVDAEVGAEAGYFVIHPNFRNYPPSDSGPDAFRTGYAIDVLNLIAIIRAQSLDPEGPLRRADREAIHLWGHSMGGNVLLRAMLVEAEIKAGAIWAGAVYLYK